MVDQSHEVLGCDAGRETLSEDDIRRAHDTAFEARLIERHLGANGNDLYVFDNPWNEANDAQDLRTAGADGHDWRTYRGAMNHLIRLILSDDPMRIPRS